MKRFIVKYDTWYMPWTSRIVLAETPADAARQVIVRCYREYGHEIAREIRILLVR